MTGKGKGKRYKEEQIVRILQEAETGIAVRDVCRKHDVSEQTFYRWRQRYGGMDLSEVRKMKELESENSRLKKIIADQALTIDILKEVNSKKW